MGRLAILVQTQRERGRLIEGGRLLERVRHVPIYLFLHYVCPCILDHFMITFADKSILNPVNHSCELVNFSAVLSWLCQKCYINWLLSSLLNPDKSGYRDDKRLTP